MFCRFGSLLLKRPVAATAWLKQVCTRPVSGFTSCGSASMYVPFSFISARHSRIWRGRSWASASSSSTSTAVDGARDVPVRFRTGSCSLSNRISASCLGELMLNSPPASSKISAVRRASSCSMRCDCAASAGPSMRTPARSTPTSTGISGSSSVVVHLVELLLFEQVAKQRRQLAGEVGALARVVDGRLDRHVRQRHRLGAAAAHVLLGQRLVAGVLERQIFQPCADRVASMR